MTMKYLFGPVNSRRLGISLGIDLLPAKTCTLNCIYCECGATTDLTMEIREYVPAGEVMEELDSFLSSGPVLDYITFSGAGEPTLHSRIGDIISHIKKNHHRYRVAVLTNGTLLWKKEVRDALMHADLVVPSLDAYLLSTFRRVLRPHRDLDPATVLEGLVRFGNEYRGSIVLEVFIIPGINTSREDLAAIKKACAEIRHDEIHLNTLDRPGAVKGIKTAGPKEMRDIADFFSPMKVKIVGRPGELDNRGKGVAQDIVDIIRRRPSTAEELQLAIGMSLAELAPVLKDLVKDCVIREEKLERGVFYRLL